MRYKTGLYEEWKMLINIDEKLYIRMRWRKINTEARKKIIYYHFIEIS